MLLNHTDHSMSCWHNPYLDFLDPAQLADGALDVPDAGLARHPLDLHAALGHDLLPARGRGDDVGYEAEVVDVLLDEVRRRHRRVELEAAARRRQVHSGAENEKDRLHSLHSILS